MEMQKLSLEKKNLGDLKMQMNYEKNNSRILSSLIDMRGQRDARASPFCGF